MWRLDRTAHRPKGPSQNRVRDSQNLDPSRTYSTPSPPSTPTKQRTRRLTGSFPSHRITCMETAEQLAQSLPDLELLEALDSAQSTVVKDALYTEAINRGFIKPADMETP